MSVKEVREELSKKGIKVEPLIMKIPRKDEEMSILCLSWDIQK